MVWRKITKQDLEDTKKRFASEGYIQQYDNPRPRHPFSLNPPLKRIEAPIDLSASEGQYFRPSFW
jgi:hypothetical protein